MDYLDKYIKDKKFNIPELINDDFFKAINLCFNNKLYVSSIKLLLSFVDSISYVSYGESNGQIFQKWLNEFCEMQKITVTASELWEHRNSILHTTGIESFKVKRGECRILIGYVGELPSNFNTIDETYGYYNIYDLIQITVKGLEKYIQKIREENGYTIFVERYDQIVSDVRHMVAEK